MNNLKLGSLFDGVGTFPLSGLQYGFTPVWASEIEAFPIAVTKHHFPDMKHLGDITKINGAEIEPVDVITFGSPCQDMSVAGKRGGLCGARSGLFMEAVRIIREMRTATGGKYPRFAVWENVPGAYSSNKGQDFRAVLEEIAEAEIPMPASEKWAEAGMVRTERIDVAWRTLDAQYWGVPQRRKRIFLVADFGGQCAGEILFVESRLPWNFETGREAREEVAGDAGYGFKAAGFKSEQSADARSIGWQIETAPTLPSEGSTPCICSRISCTPEGITGAVSSKWAKGTGRVGDEHYNLVVEPFAIENHPADSRANIIEDGTIQKLTSRMGTGGGNVPMSMQPIPIHDQATRYNGKHGDKQDGKGNGFGVGNPGDPMNTLGTTERHAVAYPDPTNALLAKANLSFRNDQDTLISIGYAVRRLTPLECERLQWLPDNWTNIEGAKDTNRYKAIGNGIAKPCSDFVLSGIARVLAGTY